LQAATPETRSGRDGVPGFIPLVGYPIGQVLTPPLFNARFAALGLDVTMIPVEMSAERIASFFAAIRGWSNCAGCSVTIPHKQAAFGAVDAHTERARNAGAVNFLRRAPDGRLIGDMTDGLAMAQAIADTGFALAGARTLLAGAAGGAGGAIADALCAAGIASLHLLDPRAEACAALGHALKARYPGVAVGWTGQTDRHDLAVNASPMGMRPDDPLPIDLGTLAADALVADVVTKPVVTALIAAARQRGMRTVTGDMMAAAQLPFQLRHLGLDEGARE
jgi:shikimate dehydrogenase